MPEAAAIPGAMPPHVNPLLDSALQTCKKRLGVTSNDNEYTQRATAVPAYRHLLRTALSATRCPLQAYFLPTGFIESSPRLIARHYLRTWFPVDVGGPIAIQP
jgi:hypothetical protein